MAKYTEYKRCCKCDFFGDGKVIEATPEEIGEITIYENHIESEKEIFIDTKNTRYRFRLVTMVSGAKHYLLKDKCEYNEGE
jgi:hypothetical protein